MIKKNILTIIVALVIMYLSLTNGKKFDKLSPFEFFDKVVHACMYFGFMLMILFENRKTLLETKRILLCSLIPVLYGILMEILQSTLTTTRTGSFFDALFDAIGVYICILLWQWIKPFSKAEVK